MKYHRIHDPVEPTPDERQLVQELLGRRPQGPFSVVVVDTAGRPVVIRNGPFLDDGRPMPTTYWLVDPELLRAVSRIEGRGGVREAEAAIGLDAIAAVHRRYASERDEMIPDAHDGPRPSGGVGGTRRGVKCLHTHLAHHLARGDDPVGEWVLDRLEETNDGRS